MALAHAELHGRVVRNVAALARAPRKTAVKLDDSLDAEEAAAVLEAAQGDRLEALATLELAVGLRQGEALAMVWSGLALDAGALRIRKAKTDAGVREVALPAFVVAVLREHRGRQRQERMAATRWDDPELVFAPRWARGSSRATCSGGGTASPCAPASGAGGSTPPATPPPR